MGISSLVRLAAWMPAIRAVAMTSPLGRFPASIAASAFWLIRTAPRARASRAVTGFAETSTMRASPRASRWVSFADFIGQVLGEHQGHRGGHLSDAFEPPCRER